MRSWPSFVDINECKLSNACTQLHADCTNFKPWYKCTCRKGWRGIEGTGTDKSNDTACERMLENLYPCNCNHMCLILASCDQFTVEHGSIRIVNNETDEVRANSPLASTATLTCDSGYVPNRPSTVCIADKSDADVGGVWADVLHCIQSWSTKYHNRYEQK